MAEDASPEETTFSIGDRAFRLSRHAARRMTERGIATAMLVEALTNGEGFRYFHEGSWKDGYYDRSTGVFVGVIDEVITTVIRGASESYIANLRAGAP